RLHYQTWDEFCRAELGMSRRTVDYRIAALTEYQKTHDERGLINRDASGQILHIERQDKEEIAPVSRMVKAWMKKVEAVAQDRSVDEAWVNPLRKLLRRFEKGFLLSEQKPKRPYEPPTHNQTCRKCKAKVTWASTLNRKRVPLEQA